LATHPQLRPVLIDRVAHDASAARRSAGSAAKYWATMEAVMLAMIPARR
jgi:hypothetical protein